jgi:hypothetical protein
MAEITESQIAENAASPKKFTGDQGSAEQHSIPDQILADQYRKKGDLLTSVQRTGRLPFMRSKVTPTWPS